MSFGAVGSKDHHVTEHTEKAAVRGLRQTELLRGAAAEGVGTALGMQGPRYPGLAASLPAGTRSISVCGRGTKSQTWVLESPLYR